MALSGAASPAAVWPVGPAALKYVRLRVPDELEFTSETVPSTWMPAINHGANCAFTPMNASKTPPKPSEPLLAAAVEMPLVWSVPSPPVRP